MKPESLAAKWKQAYISVCRRVGGALRPEGGRGGSVIGRAAQRVHRSAAGSAHVKVNRSPSACVGVCMRTCVSRLLALDDGASDEDPPVKKSGGGKLEEEEEEEVTQ